MIFSFIPGHLSSGLECIGISIRVKISLFLFFVTMGNLSLEAQHQDLQEKPGIWQAGTPQSGKDTANLLDRFRKGKLNGHIRYYYSQTTNQGNLTDYYANALGGGIRFESASWHGFQAGVSGFYVFNLGSSKLDEKDPLTNLSNRYEVGLFDVTDPSNTNEINRLEELYLKYQKGKIKLTAGRQLLNTPFINLQDGRMRPTAAQGVWLEFPLHSHHLFQFGWVNGIAPRGTRKWYTLASSIGLYSAGIGPDGKKSLYPGQVVSSGASLFNYTYRPGAQFAAHFWHLWVQNVMHTSMGQVDYTLKSLIPVSFSIQALLQLHSGNGGNTDATKAYFTNEKPVWTSGARVTFQFPKWEHVLAINYISAGGRYLMPREWGRDPFFTFLPRERNEGYGDVFSLMAKSQFKSSKRYSATMAAGYYKLPGIEQVSINKYGMTSYLQTLIDVRYQFNKLFEGWEIQALYTYKMNMSSGDLRENAIFNKVNMHLLNIVVNFRF